jgi:hypothetical protein
MVKTVFVGNLEIWFFEGCRTNSSNGDFSGNADAGVAGRDGGGADCAISRATGTLLQRMKSFSLFFSFSVHAPRQ